MPPRIPEFPCLQALRTSLPTTNGPPITLSSRAFSSTPSIQAATLGSKRRFRDPYIVAQAKARKAANISKQANLKLRREKALGNPVRGVETNFVKSFDTAKEPSTKASRGLPTNVYLNHYLQEQEIKKQLERSKQLVEPASKTTDMVPQRDDVTKGAHQAILDQLNVTTRSKFLEQHSIVEEAMKRITNLDNGNSKDRFRVNVVRCIETFGRHNTDKTLIPKAPASSFLNLSAEVDLEANAPQPKRVRRKGPDTGSSEVQIAVLTARIRHLANHLDRVGSSDKVGKRDLRLLVHRRQKLLQYLRKKERAGPRWQKCIETLGLTEGTWRGEISL